LREDREMRFEVLFSARIKQLIVLALSSDTKPNRLIGFITSPLTIMEYSVRKLRILVCVPWV
jgi:hypothetical protein